MEKGPLKKLTREEVARFKRDHVKKAKKEEEASKKARQEKIDAYLDNKRAWERALGKRVLRFRKMPRHVVLRKAMKKSHWPKDKVKILSNIRLRQVAATGSIPSLAALR